MSTSPSTSQPPSCDCQQHGQKKKGAVGSAESWRTVRGLAYRASIMDQKSVHYSRLQSTGRDVRGIAEPRAALMSPSSRMQVVLQQIAVLSLQWTCNDRHRVRLEKACALWPRLATRKAARAIAAVLAKRRRRLHRAATASRLPIQRQLEHLLHRWDP